MVKEILEDGAFFFSFGDFHDEFLAFAPSCCEPSFYSKIAEN
jgi:hypothetical protein